MRAILLAAAVSLCLAAAPALGASKATTIKADPSVFPSAKAQIEKDLADGKTYSELTATKKREVLAALERIEDVLAEAPSVEALPTEAKVKLINDQEFVNTVLTQVREDSRLICRQESKTGSHRRMPKCQTLAERRRELENSQDALRDHQRIKMPCRENPGCLDNNGNRAY
jgi:hypothetical protein